MKTITEGMSFVRVKMGALVVAVLKVTQGVWCSQINEKTTNGGITVDGIVTFEDRSLFSSGLKIADGQNVAAGTSTGVSIGTSTSQKVSLYGVPPVAQQSHIADAQETHTGTDVAALRTEMDALGAKINGILALLETYGFTATS